MFYHGLFLTSAVAEQYVKIDLEIEQLKQQTKRFLDNTPPPVKSVEEIKQEIRRAVLNLPAQYPLVLTPAGFASSKSPLAPPDPHAALADVNSPTFDPLEYKRLTGALPKVALEAVRKLKLIED